MNLCFALGCVIMSGMEYLGSPGFLLPIDLAARGFCGNVQLVWMFLSFTCLMLFGYAWCNLDLVCWKCFMCGSGMPHGAGWFCKRWGQVSVGSRSWLWTVPDVSRVRWPVRFLLFWVCNCRIGEAAVPGPQLPGWSIGVCNPSGLMNKGHLLDPQVDCWCVCETHFSLSGYHRFLSGLRSEGSEFKWCVPGAHVPCRSTVSSIGAWSGVAVVSKWPSRALPVDWPDAVHASSRLVCATTFIHDVWVSGVTMYGTPVGPTHPNARATSNRLLQHAVSRIAQSHGPRYVAGDWNHDLEVLDAVDGLLAMGFKEVQDLHFAMTGIHPKPTCKMRTRRDFLFLSPELQRLFVSCQVDHCAWPDHSAVVASFRGGSSELVQYPWPLPRAIPWSKLAGRSDGSFIDFEASPDPNLCYQQLWQDVEKCASRCASAKGRPLPSECFGRAHRFAPLESKARPPPVPLGRKGDCQPEYFGSSWTHARMFRQVRRLQSYVRLSRSGSSSPSCIEHKVSLWRSIVNASGFSPNFRCWWKERSASWGVVAFIPTDPPSVDVAVCIFEVVKQSTREFEQCLIKHRSYVGKLKRGHDMAGVYAAVRRDPPVAVDVLLHCRQGVVSSVDDDDQALEFADEVDWIPDCPLVHQGRCIPVHMATPDKVWMESTAGILPGHTVVQRSGVGKLSDIFDAFVQQWSQRWCRHDAIPDSQWSSIIDFVRDRFQPVESAAVCWNIPLLCSTIAGKKKRSACGLDGVSRADLVSLRMPHLRSVLSMFNQAEGCGEWPVQPLVGVVRSLAKVPQPGGVNDFRPITVLGLLYRVWSTVHARFWLKKLDLVVDPFLYGSRSGCRASQVWRYMLDQVEWAQHTSQGVAGVILDLSKAFNTLPRYPTFAVAKLLGIHHSTLVGWAGALKLLERRFMVRGSVSPPVGSSTGFPEGCALSCVAMLLVDQVFHSWIRAGTMMVTPVSYVDNWELILNCPEEVSRAIDRALDFARQWDLSIDSAKTFAWGSDRESRRILRAAGLVVRHDAKDLGAHLVYSRQLRNQSLLQRVDSLDDFWTKLQASRGSFCQKIRAVRTGAWPRAFHGVSAVILGKKHWPVIRTKYMKALKLLKPGASALLQMLLDCSDPQLYAIWTSLLDFRALGRHDSQLVQLDLVGAQAVNAAQASVSQVLCHRVHQLGWSVEPGGFARDRYGSFSMVDCCVQELHWRVSLAWIDFVSGHVASRQDFKEFGRVDVVASRRGLQDLSLVDRAAMRAVLNGTMFTNRHAYRWSSDGSLLCPVCNLPDGLHHKYWQCSWIRDLVDEVPEDVRAVLPSLPIWVRDRGWTFSPKLLDAWRSYLVGLQVDFAGFRPPDTPGPLDLFTDGSCIPGISSDLNVAAWAVCVGSTGSVGVGSESFRVLCSGPLVGLSQSAYRAELFALYAAVCIASRTESSCRIWSDCAAVIAKFRRLTSGCQKLNVNSKHVDLLRLILQVTDDVGLERIWVAKVTAHVVQDTLDNEVELWLARGNAAADSAADAANRDRGPHAWSLWSDVSEAVAKAQHVSTVIRSHLVAVNRRWYQRFQGTDQPAVHQTRVARSIPVVWENGGPYSLSRGQVAKFFGSGFAERVQQWWNSVVDFEATEVGWVSYVELYLDWQMVEKHPGVAKHEGRWFEFSDLAMIPERFTFRVRCKYFRLLIQQLARDMKVQFATQTNRPSCQYLQLHVGVASIPIRRGRLSVVADWLKGKVPRPIAVQEMLDEIPPAWL